ncbi:MAG: hypothetical protein FRX49_00437 [Trebouxia sp. A1-2]|nr:MAG: hypothetical protein FRX49_00437 [Trebouxia sp. A1-2]
MAGFLMTYTCDVLECLCDSSLHVGQGESLFIADGQAAAFRPYISFINGPIQPRSYQILAVLAPTPGSCMNSRRVAPPPVSALGLPDEHKANVLAGAFPRNCRWAQVKLLRLLVASEQRKLQTKSTPLNASPPDKDHANGDCWKSEGGSADAQRPGHNVYCKPEQGHFP